MGGILDIILAPETLVLTAGGLFTIGYLIINQMLLRVFVLMGTFLYIGYYATVAAEPLWEAIVTSCVMGGANLIGIFNLLVRRTRWIIPRQHRDIYPLFSTLPPGDFRAIMQAATRQTIDEDTVLSAEGDTVTHVYFVLSGGLIIHKLGEKFSMGYGIFVGEAAYIAGNKSAATSIAVAGSDILVWEIADLRRRAKRNPRFGLAFDALIAPNLALKVVSAVPPRPGVAPSRDEDIDLSPVGEFHNNVVETYVRGMRTKTRSR